jgi:flagellar biosynthesis protein FlhB
MSGGRTEQPTPRRVEEARRRGEVAVSRELTGVAALAGGLAALVGTAGASAAGLAAHLRATLAAAPEAADAAEAGPALARAAALLATALAPVLLASTASALAAGLLQTRGLFAAGAVAFRAERLHPAHNLRKLVSPGQLAQHGLALGKATAGILVGVSCAGPLAPAVARLPALGPGAVLASAGPLLLPLVARLLPLVALFAAVDLALARRAHLRALRMTRDEVLREQRQEEGDPRHKAERRRRHRALLDATPVSRATCVVVNPTHLAIALLHDRAGEDAPLVVAKGAGAVAARIRREARRAGVPVIHDVPLARALWRLAGLGEAIPEELYDAAAAVLVHVHGLPGEGPP